MAEAGLLEDAAQGFLPGQTLKISRRSRPSVAVKGQVLLAFGMLAGFPDASDSPYHFSPALKMFVVEKADEEPPPVRLGDDVA